VTPKNILKIYKHYISAIKFEYEHESIYHDYMQINGLLKYVPRSYLIKTRYKYVNRYVYDGLYCALYIMWPFIIQPLLSLSCLFKYSILQALTPKSKYVSNSLYLATSDPKYFSYIDSDQEKYPETILTSPFRPYSDSVEIPRLSLMSLTQVSDLIQVFLISIIIPLRCLISPNHRHLLLYSYSSFQWVWMYLVLHNIKPTNIWLSNHYDRWNVLVSALNETPITMVQHGDLFHKDAKLGTILFPEFTMKLDNIYQIFTYDEDAVSYYKKYINTEHTIFRLIDSKVKIISWREMDIHYGKKIMIVGNYSEQQFHNDLIMELYKCFGGEIAVCYKLHPRQTNSCDIEKVWNHRDSSSIPFSDIVITYGSSVDAEIIRLTGTHVIRYSIQDRIENKEKCISDIILEIQNEFIADEHHLV